MAKSTHTHTHIQNFNKENKITKTMHLLLTQNEKKPKSPAYTSKTGVAFSFKLLEFEQAILRKKRENNKILSGNGSW